jgi:hypothetical protein
MSRSRKFSPFPTAYKIINDHENNATPTVRMSVLPELLDVCRHRGVTCAHCGTFDELGFDWSHAVIIEKGAAKHSWYCKLCFKQETSPEPYSYSSTGLDGAIEEPFSKPKKT